MVDFACSVTPLLSCLVPLTEEELIGGIVALVEWTAHPVRQSKGGIVKNNQLCNMNEIQAISKISNVF